MILSFLLLPLVLSHICRKHFCLLLPSTFGQSLFLILFSSSPQDGEGSESINWREISSLVILMALGKSKSSEQEAVRKHFLFVFMVGVSRV